MTRRKQLLALATVAAVLVLAVVIDGWLVWRHAGQTIGHIAEKKEEEVDLTSLVTRLDNRESRVITRNTGVLRRADTNLESRARQYAEQGIRTEALKKGILPMASQNAEVKVGELLHTLGFRKVRFEIATAPSPG